MAWLPVYDDCHAGGFAEHFPPELYEAAYCDGATKGAALALHYYAPPSDDHRVTAFGFLFCL